MVKHIILWTLRDEYSESEKTAIKKGMKESLESLTGKIPGLLKMEIQTECLDSSKNAEVMLYSEFESKEALKAYSTHPEHVAVADTKVRPYTASRSCIDFEAGE